MKRYPFVALALAFSIIPLAVFAEKQPSPSTIKRKQGELRNALRKAEDVYSKFQLPQANVSELWLQRQKEMSVLLSRQAGVSIPQHPTHAGASLIWQNRVRTAPPPVATAQDYASGPNGAVIPFSGEFTDTANDLSGLERGGIGFSLQRRYSAFSKYDCGFGIGWNFNYNAGIIVAGDNLGNASKLTMFIGERDTIFTKNGNNWTPEPGMFLRLESLDNRIFVYTPDLLRYEFEPAVEQNHGVQRWRLVKISARHDQYRANCLTISHLPGCDRIQDITDPFGEKFSFVYTADGHISQIASPKQYVEYSYDNTGKLIRVLYTPIKLSLAGNDFQPEIKYQYSKGQDPLLVSKSSSSQNYTLSIRYDAHQRVTEIGFIAQDQQQIWNFEYRPGNVTLIKAPQPSAEVYYTFTGTPHPSLPGTLEIPAHQAKWQYTFNQDFLLTSITEPLGSRKVRTYDSANADVLMHGNTLKEEQFPSANGNHCGIKSRGTRTQYHDKIASPTKIEYFQINDDGTESILKQEHFVYSDENLMLICHDDGGIKQYAAHNRFGLPALKWDANKNVSIFYYAEKMPNHSSFEFFDGSVRNGGPLVRVIQDAKAQEITAACKGIGHPEIFRNEITRVSPRALISRYAYDTYGNKIRNKTGYEEKFSIFSSNGKILVSCDASTGITEYQYYKSGRPDRVYHEFCPSENDSFKGNLFLHFANSRYYTEIFKYDSLDMLIAHQLTDERFQDVIPTFRYERYPNGKVKRIINPMGLARVDEYDLKTGWLQQQILVCENLSQLLTSEYQYFADGQIKSYIDQFGGKHTFELDSFGRVAASIDPLGVRSQREQDALDREIAKSSYFDGTCLSRKEFVYSEKNQKLALEKTYLIDGNKSDVLESEKYLYDEAGNLIGKRGVREGSWQYSLIDGCGNIVATLSPEGDISVKVLRYGKPVYSSTFAKGENEKVFSNGSLAEYDFAGRLTKNTPVDANDQPIGERAQTFCYNIIGQKTQTTSEKLTSTAVAYNSIGKTIREEITPFSTNFGEKPQITEYEYRADGQMIRKKIDNQALALRGDKSNAKPELVEAPQVSEWHYDKLGRIIETVQPDGLIASKVYNEFSLPAEMKWTHMAEPGKILRHLSLKYTNIVEVASIYDGVSGKILREYTYDKMGNCVSAIDHSNPHPIHVERRFDSLGNIREEKIGYNGLQLPWSSFSYNLPDGKTSAEWINFAPSSSRNWKQETRHYDRASRLVGLSLDGDRFANWHYCGKLCDKREIPESRIVAHTTYTALMEPQEILLRDCYSNESIGRFAYEYGQQGQQIYSATQLGNDYNFSAYSQFDSYRRVVGQNGEAIIPSDLTDARKRHKEIFGEEQRAVASINTSWMVYDQANNIWGKYLGQHLKQTDPHALLTFERMPSFSSSASIIAGEPNSWISDLALRELASNREVSIAAYASDSNLKATEQKYDHLGNLVEYEGTFWNGNRRYPVKWVLVFDQLGRLSQMNATASEAMGVVKKDAPIAELLFAYDAENRRLMKQVIDHTRLGDATQHTEFTLYRENHQSLIYDYQENNGLKLKGEYLWGATERELLMAALPEHCAENQGDFTNTTRYFFQQDKGLNVAFTSKVENGKIVPVAAESFLGFGDNSTFAKISDVESSMLSANEERAYNRHLDEQLDASWENPGNNQFILLHLTEETKLAQLTIWASRFSKNFYVFVLPKGEKAPYSENLNAWINDPKHWENYFAAGVKDGKFGDRIMGDSLTSPYRLPLRELKGDRILLVFCDNNQFSLNVREFEVVKIADNPSPIAFAGQWLDRETGMYYQINRYRLAGSDKFISPDPIGFLDGNNLYAYAKGNPLEWHDPDGRWIHMLVGAGIGALWGGGGYLVSCWLTGQEINWWEFGLHAASGALASATFGLASALSPIGIGTKLAAYTFKKVAVDLALHAGAGFITGAVTGGVSDYIFNRDWQHALTKGLTTGISYAVTAGIVRGAQIGVMHHKAWVYSRPKGYKSGVREAVWEAAREKSTGQVRDPLTGRFMSKNKPWDMGHKPGHEWWKFAKHARAKGLSREQVIEWNNNPKHFRPELPSSNRSHAAEDLTSMFFDDSNHAIDMSEIESGGLLDDLFDFNLNLGF